MDWDCTSYTFTCSICVNQSTVKSPGLSTPLLYSSSSPTTYVSCKVAQALQLCLEARVEKPGRMMYFREREEWDTFWCSRGLMEEIALLWKKITQNIRNDDEETWMRRCKAQKKHHTVPECWLLVLLINVKFCSAGIGYWWATLHKSWVARSQLFLADTLVIPAKKSALSLLLSSWKNQGVWPP